MTFRTGGILDPHGPVSTAERLILLNSTAIMLVVVVPVIVMTLVFAWWYRASNARAVHRPEWAYSGRIELVVWSIPAMVVILLAGVAWIGAHELDPRAPLPSAVDPVKIVVVSLDWKWLFLYPDLHLATVNDLVVPAGAPLDLTLTSASVMNAFFVPQLGSQIYTMPGMTTHLGLLADHPGDFAGLSSHFSGGGFSDMHFMVHALRAGEFAQWVDTARRSSLALDATAYDRLAQPGTAGTVVFGRVGDGLLEHILTTAAPPGPAAAH